MSNQPTRLVRPLAALALLIASATAAPAQQTPPEIRSTVETISIRDGDELRPNAWRLAPEANPDVYEAPLPNGLPTRITFITDVDSIGFMVEEGRQYDFVIRRDGIPHYTRIVGRRFVPAATFDSAYQAANRGTMHVEIPEAYELVNVAIALTPTAIAERGMVYQNSGYYREVRAAFDPYASHPAIALLDSALRENPNRYHSLKMNGRAFEFDAAGRFVKGRVYDRTGFGGERSNPLEPYAAALDDFARTSGFRRFYAEHRPLYEAQIAFYRDTANVAEMRRWLERNFPGAVPYDSYRIVFSPLVAYNQSSTWFASNGFTELMPHVNFPYPADLTGRAGLVLSDTSAKLYRGNIVFTEINHGYINPEADKYGERIERAISSRHHWVDSAMGPQYYPGGGTFNEYLNWALVNLRLADHAPAAERDTMIARVERMMVTGRGFPRFADFSRFLVPLYLNRPAGQTLADLYPEIIAWFERENGRAGARPR